MQRIAKGRDLLADEVERDREIKQQIFEKVCRQLETLQIGMGNGRSSADLNPDVIVISDDRSFLFEPQNVEATEWLRLHFGLENLGVRDRIRVHPAQSGKMTGELRAAGFEVV